MAANTDKEIVLHRVIMVVFGALSGFALWTLVGQWDNPALAPTLYLVLFSFVATFASVALVLAGPVPMVRAVQAASCSAIIMTSLFCLAALRYLVATDVLDDPIVLFLASVLVLISTPFLMVWMQDRSGWLDYAQLFDAAWSMTVRYTVAWGFVGIFWLVVFLGNALLNLVDVSLIDIVIRTDWMRFGLTGAVLGLGLSVVFELRGMISHYLVLRLLRLLLPLVLAMVIVFIGAVPVRGLTHLFGEFSAAATLMGTAIAALTLISAALDRDDTSAVRTKGLRLATRVLALTVPLLTALALWAVVMRVRQYGWTPDRLLALTFALVLFAYGAGYCLSVLIPGSWMARIRQVNVALALLVFLVALTCMTPLLDFYRISTKSQIARFESGRVSLDKLSLWAMAHDWGKAGRAGIAALEAMTDRPDHEDLVDRITTMRSEDSAFQFERSVNRQAAPARVAELLEHLPLRPDGIVIAEDRFIDVPDYRVDGWLKGCKQELPDGRAGCVLVQGAFAPAVAAVDQAAVLYIGQDGRVQADHVVWRDGTVNVSGMFDALTGEWSSLPADILSKALDGAFEIRPSGENALFLGGSALVSAP